MVIWVAKKELASGTRIGLGIPGVLDASSRLKLMVS